MTRDNGRSLAIKKGNRTMTTRITLDILTNDLDVVKRHCERVSALLESELTLETVIGWAVEDYIVRYVDEEGKTEAAEVDAQMNKG